MSTGTSGWFARAIAVRGEDHFVDVDQCPIHYHIYGNPADKPGLLLIAGTAAHTHWWDFIAPYFTEDYCVVSMDPSGHGDSGHRPEYHMPVFAREVEGVINHAGLRETTIIGHSFGAAVTLEATRLLEGRLQSVIIVDLGLNPPGHKPPPAPRPDRVRPRPPRPKEELLQRFRLMPPQECAHQEILDYIATTGMRREGDLWNWKFDNGFMSRMRWGDPGARVPGLSCPAAVVYGEQSFLNTHDLIPYLKSIFAEGTPFVAIPEANHHLFLDQPLATITTFRALLQQQSTIGDTSRNP